MILSWLTIAPQIHRQKQEKSAEDCGGSGVGGDGSVYAAHGVLSGIRDQRSVEFRSDDYFYFPPAEFNYLQKRGGGMGFLFRVPEWGSWFSMSEDPLIAMRLR